MGWTSASMDTYSNYKCNLTFKFGKLADAVAYAEAMGWGFDITYPTNTRWHVKKNYADNFAWKGKPTEEEQYD